MTDTAVTHRSVSEIIKAAGGASAIAEASCGSITMDAVYKWPKIGIPGRHWPFILPLAQSTAEEMLAANVAARSESAEIAS